jgi:hypothetical protein
VAKMHRKERAMGADQIAQVSTSHVSQHMPTNNAVGAAPLC